MNDMANNMIFNATVCLIGFLILLVHIANILTKPARRKDEKALLSFFIFTAVHFATYFAFTMIRSVYTSDAFIMGFYTTFYVMNNLEVVLLFVYMLVYVEMSGKTKQTLQIINLALLAIFVILDFVNLGTHMFFFAEGGEYIRAPTMFLSQGYQFVMLGIVFFVALLNKKLTIREKVAFSSYCVLPLVAIVLQNVFKGYAIAYLSIIIAIEILFFFLNVEKSILLAKEEEKNKEAQIKIMLSQIRPHFIYNSLSAISTLIPMDPDGAQKALDDFTEYLRHNLSSLTEERLIPFEAELRHIKTYLSLEKLRFQERINVQYDIGVKDFNVAPLSIQPLVENAVRHGLLPKIEGGTLVVRTYEDESSYVIEVKDDGVGFDIEKVDFEANEHFGINNIRYRISKMSGGSLEFDSVIGEGTKATVTIGK